MFIIFWDVPIPLIGVFYVGMRGFLLRVFSFVDAFLDLADLFGDRDFLGTDFRAFPLSLTTPGPVPVIQ